MNHSHLAMFSFGRLAQHLLAFGIAVAFTVTMRAKAGCLFGAAEYQLATKTVYQCGQWGFDGSTKIIYSTELTEEIWTTNPSIGDSAYSHFRIRKTWDTNIVEISPSLCDASQVTETNASTYPIALDITTCTETVTTNRYATLTNMFVSLTTSTDPNGCTGTETHFFQQQYMGGFTDQALANEARRRVMEEGNWVNWGDTPPLSSLVHNSGTTVPYNYHTAQATMTRFRIKFKSERETLYTVRWKVVIDQYDGGTITNSFVSGEFSLANVPGTGDDVYTDWVETPVPALGEIRRSSVVAISVESQEGGCGTGSCGDAGSGGGSPGDGHDQLGSASFHVSLGSGDVDGAAGILRMNEESPSALLATPETLQFLVNNNVVSVVTNMDGSIHVAAPTLLARIAATNSYAYWIHCSTTNGGGGNFLTNTPFLSHLIINPNGSTNFHTLQHIRYRSGTVVTNEFVCETNNATNVTWRLVSGNGLKGERLAKITNTSNTNRLESYTIYTPATGTQLYKRDRLYLAMPHGESLLSETIDPQGLALTTTNTYDAWGRIQLSLKPDGSWERSEYDTSGWLIRVVRPLTNQPPTASTNDCRVTEYSYASVSGSGDNSALKVGSPRTWPCPDLVDRSWVSASRHGLSS